MLLLFIYIICTIFLFLQCVSTVIIVYLNLPNKLDFDYQYTTALQPPTTYKIVRIDDHTFIYTRTALIYNANIIMRGHVGGRRDIQHTSEASASHVYALQTMMLNLYMKIICRNLKHII